MGVWSRYCLAMARPPLDPGGAPVRLCVKIPEALDRDIRAVAEKRGVTVPDLVRAALTFYAAAGLAADKASRGQVRLDPPRSVMNQGPRTSVSGHRHSAAKVIAGGIGVCECGARRTTGSDWQLPRV